LQRSAGGSNRSCLSAWRPSTRVPSGSCAASRTWRWPGRPRTRPWPCPPCGPRWKARRSWRSSLRYPPPPQHTRPHTLAHVHTHSHTSTHTLAHVHTHSHTSTHTRTHPHTHSHTSAHTRTHPHTLAHIHTHSHSHPRTRTHVHTRTRTLSLTHRWHLYRATTQPPSSNPPHQPTPATHPTHNPPTLHAPRPTKPILSPLSCGFECAVATHSTHAHAPLLSNGRVPTRACTRTPGGGCSACG
jgi:hypothetical protein